MTSLALSNFACRPAGPPSLIAQGWLHEVKYDGYRLRLEREGNRVRLITRGGYDWSDRFPWIVEAARKNRHRQFVIDGEYVNWPRRYHLSLQSNEASPIVKAAPPRFDMQMSAVTPLCVA